MLYEVEWIVLLNTRKNLEFIRVHASYIVNKQYVTKYTKKFVSIGEEEIPISNKYRVNITKDSINLDVYT